MFFWSVEMAESLRVDRATRVVSKAVGEYAGAWTELTQAWNQGAEAFEHIQRAASAVTSDQVAAYMQAQDRIAKAWRLCEQKRASLDGAGAEFRAATGAMAAPDLSMFIMPPWQRLPVPSS
jgi:hypothetical protein